MKKRVVVALGHRALGTTLPEQKEAVKKTAKVIGDLIEKGYQFATQTDSEVLIYGYQEYGTALLQKLRGMFSFVIWNKKENIL